MRIEHEIHATLPVPVDAVWSLLGAFGDMSWNADITACALIGGDHPHVGSIREMHTRDGATIRERLDAIGPGYSFVYSFDGVPPGPVSSSSTTVTAARAIARPDAATTVTWRGVFDVADEDTGHTVEHINRDVVWPALISALASTLDVEPTFHTTNQPQTEGNPHENLR